jgi:hypothetical protein
VKFDTKIAVIIREDLPVWQKLNVTAFTVSGIVAANEGLVGENYEDASGNSYLPMVRQPMLMFAGSAEEIRKAYKRAMERNVPIAIFTEELFSTTHDEENRAAVKMASSDNLNLVGLALREDKKIVDKITKGLVLHS